MIVAHGETSRIKKKTSKTSKKPLNSAERNGKMKRGEEQEKGKVDKRENASFGSGGGRRTHPSPIWLKNRWWTWKQSGKKTSWWFRLTGI